MALYSQLKKGYKLIFTPNLKLSVYETVAPFCTQNTQKDYIRLMHYLFFVWVLCTCSLNTPMYRRAGASQNLACSKDMRNC